VYREKPQQGQMEEKQVVDVVVIKIIMKKIVFIMALLINIAAIELKIRRPLLKSVRKY
jgi:hypothetical protein